MCLIERVVSWDAESITCTSNSHRDPRNPLVSKGQLHAVCGIEYGAQVMAIHGRLCEAKGGKPRLGYLANVREVKFHVERLDEIGETLTIAARRLFGEDMRVIYEFMLSAAGRSLVEGRAAVVLQAA